MDGNGHPTALTPERHKRLIEELEVGDWPAMAAIRAECSPRTVERWVVEGCQFAAVEPYASFAADFVRVEARLCAEYTRVIADHALGRVRGKQKRPKGDPVWARYLLETRFRYLYGMRRDGTGGGVSVAELVLEALDKADAARADKARQVLKQLPAPLKEAARKEGFQL